MSESTAGKSSFGATPSLERFPSVFTGRAWLGWVAALVLMIPSFLPYLHHLTHVPSGQLATGYLMTDFPYYLGNGRAHFEDGFSLLYSLRYTPNPDAPKVYFQPETLFFGLIVKATGERLLASYLIFWFIGAMIFSRVAVALYERVVGLATPAHWIGVVLFFWGGGLYFLGGLIRGMAMGTGLNEVWHFDPMDGLWFIDLGRNLIIPHETYIHACFLGTILLLMNRKWGWGMVMACVTSWAHPFSGIQLLLIVAAWVVVERLAARSTEPSWKAVWPLPVLIGIHLGYHKLFLPWISHDHYVLMEQWSIPWVFPLASQMLGYALVLGLVCGTLIWIKPWREMLGDPVQRLLICWFLVTLGLVNHELFIRPVQPLHFTRGYDWMPLFLLGAPVLIALLRWLLEPSRRRWGIAAAAGLGLFFTLDNITWLADSWVYKAVGKKEPALATGIYKPRAMEDLIQRLKAPDAQGTLFINLDLASPLGYLVASETNLRAWASHQACTPYYEARIRMADEFYATGTYPVEEWGKRRLLIAFGPKDRDLIVRSLEQAKQIMPHYLAGMGAKVFYVNEGYVVYMVEPRGKGM